MLPEGRVAGVEVQEIGVFSSRVDRLFVEYRDAPADAPHRMVAKSSLADRPQRSFEGLDHELRFYRELGREIPEATARCYGGEVDPDGACVLLLEDLATEPVSWLQGPDDAHARLAIEALASLHARFRERSTELAWVPRFADPVVLEAFEHAYARGFRERRDLFEAVVPGFSRVGEALLGRIASSHASLADEPTLLHGDAHAENIPRIRGATGSERRVVLLDWAGPRVGHAGVDLGFFVSMSYPAARRAEVERDWVTLHHDCLLSAGVVPRVDPWLAYRRGVLRRIARLVGIAPDWPAAGADALRMVFHRCGTAALELEVDELV